MEKKTFYVSKDDFINFIIRVNWLFAMLYYIVVPIFHNNSYTQPVIVVGCLLSTVIWIFSLIKSKVEASSLIVFAFCIIIVLFKGILGRSYTLVDGLYSIIAFINIIGFYLTYKNIKLDKKTFDFIYIVSILLTVLFFAYSFTNIAYRCDTNGHIRYITTFAFNLNNPNAAAMHLYGLLSILLVNIYQRKHKLFIGLLCVILVYLIIRTNCRSCIIAAAAIILYILFLRQKPLPKIIVFLLILAPAIFLIVYMTFYRNGGSNFIVGNKYVFSGRQNIYYTALNELKTPFTILFGAVRKEYFYNAHNAFVSLLSSIGIIGTFCYYFLLTKSYYDIRKSSNIATACLLGLSLQACAESAMFMGNFPFSIFVVLLLLLGEYQNKDEQKEDIQ